MPLVPILFRDRWDDCSDTPLRTSRVLGQHCDSGISGDDLLTALAMAAAAQSAVQHQRRAHYNRPWRNSSLVSRDSESTVNFASDKFHINLDVQQFSPEEISVKATENSILVEGKHEEKQDEHGYISRHFVRRYALPEGHDANQVVSSLSSDGILTISAPKKALPESEDLRTIQIVQTGQPMKKLTEKAKAQTNGNATNGTK